MKRLTGIVLLSVFCFFCSCQQAQLEEPNANSENVGQNLQEVELSLIMPGGKTKTSLGLKDGDSYPVYWEEGDVITLNGKRSAAVSAADAGNAFARISVKTDASAPFNILYPGVDGISDQVTFPAEQLYREGSFDANALPMYATASSLNDEVSLEYLASVLRIPMKFTSSTTLRRITVTALNGEPISGNFAIGKTDGALNGELDAADASNIVNYTFGETGTAFAAGEAVFHIALPKGTYEGGLELRFYDNESNCMAAYAFTDSKTIEAGKVYEFSQYTYLPNGKVFLIETPADLLKFATMSGKQYTYLEVEVANDIDMTGKGYTNEGFSFYGTLNGFGHEIKGLTTPLINLLYGSVKNITLTANAVVSEVKEWDEINQYGAGLLANYVYSGHEGQIIENVTVNGSLTIKDLENNGNHYRIGGVVGQSIIPVKNCTNNATITLDGYSTDKALSIGGVVGHLDQEGADLIDCANTGKVVVKNTSVGGEFRAAGIVGYINKSADILNCTNNGAVSVTDIASNQFVSGVVGGKLKDASVEISDCVNGENGTISVSGASHSRPVYIGGIIAGCAGNGSTSITGCKNYGDITNDYQGSSYNSTSSPAISTGGIIGRITDGKAKVISCENHGTIVNNCPTTNAANPGIRLGGIIGYTHQGVSTNSGNVNYGDVTNNASSAKYINVGGVLGYIQATNTITGCSNQGTISNYGTAEEQISLGGILGRANVQTTFVRCINGVSGNVALGKVVNSGSSNAISVLNDDNPEPAIGDTLSIQVGGIIGFGNAKLIMNSSGADKTINYGPVMDNATTARTEVGGICGVSWKDDTDMSNTHNAGEISILGTYTKNVFLAGILSLTDADTDIKYATNSGSITYNAVANNAFVGGVVALFDGNGSNISNSENSGPVTASGQASGLWVAGVLGSAGYAVADYIKNSAPITVKNFYIKTSTWLAGCVGRFDKNMHNSSKTITGMENTGDITMKEGIKTDNQSSWHYIGGVVGSSDSANKTLKNCANRADIDLRPGTALQMKVRMGGLAGIVNKNPIGSRSEGDVSFRSSKGSNEVGGLIGYLNTGTYENLTFKGTVLTNGTSGTNYVGGLVGNVKSGSRTFENCAVYGTIHGANNATGAGVFYNAASATTATFTSCRIGDGTHRKASSGGTSSVDYKFDLTTQITEDQALAALAIRATEATVTDCVVVDPSTF